MCGQKSQRRHLGGCWSWMLELELELDVGEWFIRETIDHRHSDHMGHASRCTELLKQCRATGRAVSREKVRRSAEKVRR